MLHIGCAVWAYDGWAGNFFPTGLPKDERLKAYSQRLTAVECNSTFYASPTLATVKGWAEQTPETFKFSPKFPRAITHTAQLKNVAAQTASFIGVVRILGPRLGPLMLQLPPSFAPTRLPNLRDYLESLPKDIQVSVEVRHQDWFTESNGKKLDDMLATVGASRVVFDVRPAHESESPDADAAKDRKPSVPLITDTLQKYVVVRFISSPVAEENEPYINEWIPRLIQWLKEDRDIYFYVHCPVEDSSPFTARDIYHRLAAALEAEPISDSDSGDTKKPKRKKSAAQTDVAQPPQVSQTRLVLPSLPWDDSERPTTYKDMKQLSLF
jgi:uncharacterized protein YecE (DUF72 family)